jgi:hypothetical protein
MKIDITTKTVFAVFYCNHVWGNAQTTGARLPGKMWKRR